MMKCYICGSEQNQAIGFGCRDAPQINVLKCDSCTLEFLSDFSHISSAHYEKSGMHNFNPPNIDIRLAAGLKDDSRRVRDLSEKYYTISAYTNVDSFVIAFVYNVYTMSDVSNININGVNKSIAENQLSQSQISFGYKLFASCGLTF